MISIPKKILAVVADLRTVGITCVLVGGMVRDAKLRFIRKTPSKSPDWDIEMFLPLFSEEFAGIIKGILRKHGNLREDHVGNREDNLGKGFPVWNLQMDGLDIDFSLPRTEVSTGDGHRDFDVQVLTGQFSTELFKIAALRRDFTMGAMGIVLDTGEFLDPFEGFIDLKHRILQHVSDKTFSDDPLRVWRGIRFCAQHDLHPANSTFDIMEVTASKIPDNISAERITKELEKILRAELSFHGFAIAAQVLGHTHESLGLSKLRLRKIAAKLGDLGTDISFERKLMVLHEVTSGEIWEDFMFGDIEKFVRFSTELANFVDTANLHSARHVAIRIGDEMNALNTTAEALCDRLQRTLGDTHFWGVVRFFIQSGQHKPLLDGNDIQRLGITGQRIGKALTRVKELQVMGWDKPFIIDQLKREF
jgi:hypothetical protein